MRSARTQVRVVSTGGRLDPSLPGQYLHQFVPAWFTQPERTQRRQRANASHPGAGGWSPLRLPLRLIYRDALEIPEPPPGPKLSPRQQEVLELLAAGFTNSKIGEQLGVTERTVKA